MTAELDACIATFRRHMQLEIAIRLAASHCESGPRKCSREGQICAKLHVSGHHAVEW
jgi:hypothetical protein